MFTNASKTASNDTIDNNLQLSVWTLYIHDYAMNHKNKHIYSNREKHTTSKKITYAYGRGILDSSNSASLATAVIISDTAFKLVRQQSVSLRSIRQPLQ